VAVRCRGGPEDLEHSLWTAQARGLPDLRPCGCRWKDRALPWVWGAAVLGTVLARPAQREGVGRREPPAQAALVSFSWSLWSQPAPGLPFPAECLSPPVSGRAPQKQ